MEIPFHTGNKMHFLLYLSIKERMSDYEISNKGYLLDRNRY